MESNTESSKTVNNLKDLPSYSHHRLIEDLTVTRSKLACIYHKLVTNRDIKQTWAIDGEIFIKDRTDVMHRPIMKLNSTT